jgi:hypothetical protein
MTFPLSRPYILSMKTLILFFLSIVSINAVLVQKIFAATTGYPTCKASEPKCIKCYDPNKAMVVPRGACPSGQICVETMADTGSGTVAKCVSKKSSSSVAY